MKRQIKLSREDKDFLKKTFGCKEVMLWKALTFESSSLLAKKLRLAAIKRGGTIDVSGDIAETLHRTHEGEMVQRFENGTVLRVTMTDGSYVIEKAGDAMNVVSGTLDSLDDLERLQCRLAVI